MDFLGSRDVRRFLRPMMQKKQRMNLREALPLAGITVSTFIFCTSEFMPVALLTDIALSFSVTESQAGMLISVYAWMVMLLSLPLMIAASRIGFRRLFLIIVALFAFGQLLSSLATSYFMLMAARIVVACAHAIFWSIAPPMAVRVVSEDHRHMALGMVVMGESVALIAGLPLGRVIGLALGWRMTFACVAIITVIIFIYLYFVLPTIPATKPFSVRRLPVLFKTKTLRSLYLFVGVMMTAYYMCYSYIEPYLLQSVGLEEQTVTVVIAFFWGGWHSGERSVFEDICPTTSEVSLRVSSRLGDCILCSLYKPRIFNRGTGRVRCTRNGKYRNECCLAIGGNSIFES